MANLITGLDKYGFDEKVIELIFNSGKNPVEEKPLAQKKQEEIPIEEDFLFLKSVCCPVCDNVFSAMFVKSGKVRRLEADFDLRPRFQYIDTNKYDVIFCTKCGYAAMKKDFLHLTPGQRKLIKEGVCQNFKTVEEKISDTAMSYDTAIEYHKIALYNTIVKRGHASEKGYECLKISWLYRGKIEALQAGTEKSEDIMQDIILCRKEEQNFYVQAYDELVEALATEPFPICSMEKETFELLLASMAYNLGKLEEATKFVSGLLISRTANRSIKNRASDMKELIIAKMKK